MNKLLKLFGVVSAVSLLTPEAVAKQWAIAANSQDQYYQIKAQSYALKSLWSMQNPSQLFGSTQPKLKVKYLDNLGIVIIETDEQASAAQLGRFFTNSKLFADHVFKRAPLRLHSTHFRQQNIVFKNGKSPWGIKRVNAPDAWKIGATGIGAKVMVLDSGIDKSLPELKNRILGAKSFVESTKPEDLDPYNDFDGHGTHVSGTIVGDGSRGAILGVVPESRLFVSKVCIDYCSYFSVAQGVDWAIKEKVDVINVSLGSSGAHPVMERALKKANEAGIVVVAAAGNAGSSELDYPASSELTIAVGATDIYDKRAEFSQYGEGLDVVAPGVNVLSTVPIGKGRDTTITIFDGTQSHLLVALQFDSAPTELNMRQISIVDVKSSHAVDIADKGLKGKFALVDMAGKPSLVSMRNLKALGAAGVLLTSTDEALTGGSFSDDLAGFPVYMMAKSSGDIAREVLAKNTTSKGRIITKITDSSIYSGTSMATPHVTGIVAMMKAIEPDLTPDQVKEILTKSSQKIGSKLEYGSGLVSAPKAVDEVLAFSAPAMSSRQFK